MHRRIETIRTNRISLKMGYNVGSEVLIEKRRKVNMKVKCFPEPAKLKKVPSKKIAK